MDSSNGRQDVMRMAGVASLLFGVLLLLQFMTYRIAGANAYGEDLKSTMTQIIDHRAMFTLSGGAGALSVACLLPMLFGFVATLDERDRTYNYLGCLFLLVGGVLMVDAYAHFGNLVGTSMDYLHGAAPTDVMIEISDTMADQFQITEYAGLVSMGFGLLILSRSMFRSGVYQKPLAGLTTLVGVSCLLYNIVPTLLIVTRIAWGISLGASWLLAGSEADEEPESVIA